MIVWTSCEVRKLSRRLRFSSYLLRCQTAWAEARNLVPVGSLRPRPEVAAYTAAQFPVNHLFSLFCSSSEPPDFSEHNSLADQVSARSLGRPGSGGFYNHRISRQPLFSLFHSSLEPPDFSELNFLADHLGPSIRAFGKRRLLGPPFLPSTLFSPLLQNSTPWRGGLIFRANRTPVPIVSAHLLGRSGEPHI